jgi:serine/threonine-protein kinase
MAADEERPSSNPLLQVGRYVLFDEIASGGFASIHLGRTVGVGGFARTVAIKRLHRQYAKDPDVSAMFLDEAKVVARIRHPNVLPTIDLIAEDDELFLVMEYVEGITLRQLMREARRRKRRVPLPIVLRVMAGALHGLHAAHEARTERGEPLQLIHRDIAPDNILIGSDGMPRLLDFGVARALGQFHSTRSGEVKGKLAYLTPEQIKGDPISRRSDIFSASAVLWEAMTGRKLFRARTIGAVAHAVLNQPLDPPSIVADTPKKLDGIVMQGLERDPARRWPSALKMASAIEAVGELASHSVVGRYVRQAGAETINERALQVAMVEAFPLDSMQPVPARSSLRSYADDPSLDEPGLPEASLPSGPSSSSELGSEPLSDLADVRETPSASALDPTPPIALGPDQKKLIPIAVAAATVGVVITLIASLGGDPPALEAHSGVVPAAPEIPSQATAPAPDPAPSERIAEPSAQPHAQPSASAEPEPIKAPGPKPIARPVKPHPTGKHPPPPPPSGSLYGRE